MTPEQALDQLRAAGDPDRAAGSAAYHKADRTYLGVAVPVITDLVQGWRAGLDVPGRVALADALWQTNIHEARVAAAKLLTQARIKDDDAVWRLIASWVPEFDAWAIADHVCDAGGRRLLADPSRIDEVEGWTTSESLWRVAPPLSSLCPGPNRTSPNPRTSPSATVSLAGPLDMPTIPNGSSRNPSPGGSATSRSTTQRAPAPSSTSTAIA